uniref:Uncharacterized protein n=1 Tax=Rhizophora mucronata TaxID=61149 RepID=A0A2P2IYC6_RHIMU
MPIFVVLQSVDQMSVLLPKQD